MLDLLSIPSDFRISSSKTHRSHSSRKLHPDTLWGHSHHQRTVSIAAKSASKHTGTITRIHFRTTESTGIERSDYYRHQSTKPVLTDPLFCTPLTWTGTPLVSTLYGQCRRSEDHREETPTRSIDSECRLYNDHREGTPVDNVDSTTITKK